eukprot:3099666-Lingulodinium_polyedra.AAC.1
MPHQYCLGCQCPAALGRENRPGCLVEEGGATQAGAMAFGSEEAGVKLLCQCPLGRPGGLGPA